MTMAQLTAELLAYVDQNPHAADTVDGVGQSWLARHSSASRDDVLHALEKLVEEGRLVKHVLPDGRCVYCRRRAV
jgi:hypothetical protein